MINKIKHIANEARQKSNQYVNTMFSRIANQLNELDIELQSIVSTDYSYEENLPTWQRKLAKMAEILDVPVTINIHNESTPLVNSISLEIDDKANVIQIESDTSDRQINGSKKIIRITPQAEYEKKPTLEAPPISTNVDHTSTNLEKKQRELAPKQSDSNSYVSYSTNIFSMNFNDSDDESSSRVGWLAKYDIAQYRDRYPYERSDPTIKSNYLFYTNKIQCEPGGDYIDNIHKKWYGDYYKLEYHHDYIQWLFPIRESGTNIYAKKLQTHEIEMIRKDREAYRRILKSYELMLDFYGFQLIDETSGDVKRSSAKDYVERLKNLNNSLHNYLRITRILKCLGEFGYEHLKLPFIKRILWEGIVENTLPNCLPSCKDYWIETLLNQNDRRALRKYARTLIAERKNRIK